MRLLTAALLALLLSACVPEPTVEKAAPEGVGALFYRYEQPAPVTGGASGGVMSGGSLPLGRLIITTAPVGSELPEHPPLVSGYADITGYNLRVASPYCVNACRANEHGFIGFLFESKDYGDTIEVELLEGVPVSGKAVMHLEDEDVSREVDFR